MSRRRSTPQRTTRSTPSRAALSDDPFAVLGRHAVDARRPPGAGHPDDAAARDASSSSSAIAAIVPMARRHPRRAVRGDVDADGDAAASSSYRFRIHEPAATSARSIDPYRFGQVLTDFDLHLFSRGHALPRVGEARRAPHDDRRRRRRALRRLGAQRAARQRHRRLQPVGRPRAPDAQARAVGHLGNLRSRAARRRLLQVRDPHDGRPPAAQGRSVRPLLRGAAEHGVGRLDRRRYEWRDDDWMRDRAVVRRLARAADVGLRGASRLVAARARGGAPAT